LNVPLVAAFLGGGGGGGDDDDDEHSGYVRTGLK
jgi:hypothetical protein